MQESNFDWTNAELAAAIGRLEALYLYLDTIDKAKFHQEVGPRIKPLIRISTIIARDSIEIPHYSQSIIANQLVTTLIAMPLRLYVDGVFFGRIAHGTPPYMSIPRPDLPEITDMLPVNEIFPANIGSLPHLVGPLNVFRRTFQQVASDTNGTNFLQIKTAASSIFQILDVAHDLIPIVLGRQQIASHKNSLAEKVTLGLKPRYGIELKAIN